MRCVFTFICNDETPDPPDPKNAVTVDVDPMVGNAINIIESAIKTQHQRMHPGSYLKIYSIECEGLTTREGESNLYSQPLMYFKDSGDIYYFTIKGSYNFEAPANYKEIATNMKADPNNSWWGTSVLPGKFGGRRWSRRSRKSRKSRKSRRR